MENENIGFAVSEQPVKVLAKSGIILVPKSSVFVDALSVLFSVLIIIGGLSGKLVLRGTQSSGALAVAGFVFLIIDIIGIRSRQQKMGIYKNWIAKLHQDEDAVLKNSRQLSESVPVKIVYEKANAFLQFKPALNGVSMKNNRNISAYEGTVSRKKSILNFEGMELTVVFEVKGSEEIVFSLVREQNNRFGIVVPASVRFVSDTVKEDTV